MKKLFFLFSMVLFAGCTFAQSKPDIDKIPPFRILKTDSTWFTPADIRKNKPVMIIYFSPDCSHCQHLMYEMKPRMKEFGDTQIVMVTFTSTEMLKMIQTFYRDFDL
ncbi:MAG: hypothetical protein ABI203_08280, partial [Mucilaginibacter sp.]